MLTAQQIHEKNFTRVRKGYDMDEVDAFLDEIVQTVDRLSRENKEFNVRIEALNKQIESYRGMENTMMHTMVTVHKASEEITEKAKQEAEEIYTQARQEAEEMVMRAERESSQMLVTAREEAEKAISEYQIQIDDTKATLASLKNLLDEFKSGVHSYTAELLDFVDSFSASEEVNAVVEEVETFEEEVPVDYLNQYVDGVNNQYAAEAEELEEADDEPYYGPVDVDEEEDYTL